MKSSTTTSVSLAAVIHGTRSTGSGAVDVEHLIAGYGSPAPAIGVNVEGGNVTTKFINAHNDKQILFLVKGEFLYEKPGEASISVAGLLWCGDLASLTLKAAMHQWVTWGVVPMRRKKSIPLKIPAAKVQPC